MVFLATRCTPMVFLARVQGSQINWRGKRNILSPYQMRYKSCEVDGDT